MQFKMAKNSLFAILLRSPWWYSALLALVLILLVQLAFGTRYVVFGIAGALPFLVIAGMSVYRQMQVPGTKQVEQTVESVRDMSAREFTARLERAYADAGQEVEAFNGNAADFQITQGWRVKLVASKRFKAANTGVEPLRALVDAIGRQEATGGVYVALGSLSDNARKFATSNNIDILDAPGLTALLSAKRK